jgi:hypothetical protein
MEFYVYIWENFAVFGIAGLRPKQIHLWCEKPAIVKPLPGAKFMPTRLPLDPFGDLPACRFYKFRGSNDSYTRTNDYLYNYQMGRYELCYKENRRCPSI